MKENQPVHVFEKDIRNKVEKNILSSGKDKLQAYTKKRKGNSQL